jgi:anti-anti-sigma regulatory factor
VASNFQIYSFKTRDSLHLKLAGDFDGTSAYELINTLAEHGKGFYEIFIDVNDLKSIHPFGRDVFQKNLRSSNKLYRNLVFIGKNGHEIGTT